MRKKIYGMSILFFLFDQLTKWIVVNQLPYGVPHSIIPSFFSLTYVKNTGGAFSIFQDHVTLLACLGIFFLIVALLFVQKSKISTWKEAIAVAGILGGISGNLVDRIFRGGVVDFFDFTFFGYSYPVFNVADICLVLGVLFFLWEEIKGEIHENRKRKHSS